LAKHIILYGYHVEFQYFEMIASPDAGVLVYVGALGVSDYDYYVHCRYLHTVQSIITTDEPHRWQPAPT